jgi:hypothetical protein
VLDTRESFFFGSGDHDPILEDGGGGVGMESIQT